MGKIAKVLHKINVILYSDIGSVTTMLLVLVYILLKVSITFETFLFRIFPAWWIVSFIFVLYNRWCRKRYGYEV